MSDSDESDRPATPSETWTTAYRTPIAIVSGVLAVACCWLLFTGGVAGKWIGGVGAAVLVLWVIVFQSLYRRGH